MPKEAIVIGGSIAGLMAGIMLKHNGLNVTILEAASGPRHGYDAGIKIGPDVEAYLAAHDDVHYDMVITCMPGFKINADGGLTPGRGQTLVNTSWGLFNSILRAGFDGRASKAVPVPPKPREGDGQARYLDGRRVVDLREDKDGRMSVQYTTQDNKTLDLSADMVVVADGSTSSTRSLLLPAVERTYAGYMCWRGTVSETLVDPGCNAQYAAKTSFHLMRRNYVLNYTIPTDDGVLAPGHRLHNWLWYSRATESSPALNDTFTDVHGHTHRSTIARGLIRPDVWDAQTRRARDVLPPGLAAIVCATPAPFATKVFDVACERAAFCGGKVFLVGDAQTTLRPNIGMGVTHAAHDINALERVVKGEMGARKWEREVLGWSRVQQGFARVVCAYGMGSWGEMVWMGFRWVVLVVGWKLGFL